MSEKLKIFVNKAGESWVVDRFRDEWIKYSIHKSKREKNSDIIWIIAPWTWSNLNATNLINKKVVCTIHHLDLNKFNVKEKKDFYLRDDIVDEYHVPSQKTFEQLKSFTDKKINIIPFWIDTKKFFNMENKDEIRAKYSIPKDCFVIGSFQRDTEGKDLISPKLSKGPDKLIEYLKIYNREKKNLLVLLSGYRRQYLIFNILKNHLPKF